MHNKIFVFSVFQVNNSINVNSVTVPDSDLMATNGVIHVVNNLLYPPGLFCSFIFAHFDLSNNRMKTSCQEILLSVFLVHIY